LVLAAARATTRRRAEALSSGRQPEYHVVRAYSLRDVDSRVVTTPGDLTFLVVDFDSFDALVVVCGVTADVHCVADAQLSRFYGEDGGLNVPEVVGDDADARRLRANDCAG
jgi:hypothetical protein